MPIDRLRRPDVLRPLARREIQLLVAVTPQNQSEVADLLRAARDEGVNVGVWPLLEDSRGRWAHSGNMGAFVAFAQTVVDDLVTQGLRPAELVFDLEPHIERVRGWAHRLPGSQLLAPGVRRNPFGRAHGQLRDTVAALHAAGTTCWAAVLPMLLTDPGPRGVQRTLGTPVHGIGFSRLCPMLYTTLIEGYGGPLLRRRDAEFLLWSTAQHMRGRGDGASVALGVVGPGALGNERGYRSPDELRRDVAIVRAAGIEDIALFDLGGALERPPMEAWLDALDEPAGAEPEPTWRGRAVAGATWLAGRLLGRG